MKIKTGKRAFAALIAVVMVLGMFPLAALADGNTVAIDTTEGTGTTYDPVAKSIILKAGISKASADVTVLAIKCDSEITLAELNDLAPAEIANKIAYINQVESDSEGKVNMTFKLRELDGDYVTVAVGGEGVTEPKVCSFSTKIAAATFDVADYYIAGEEIAFNVTDANGWIAADKAVKVDGVVVESGVVFDGTTMTLGDPLVFALGAEDEEKTFALTIETEEHSTISKEIKVVAPTKVAYDELAAEGALTVDYAGGDMAEGAATVTLPAATYAGATVTWAITPDATIDAGVAALPRAAADSAEPNTVYTLTATIEANGYKTLSKVYTATVNRLGLAGVEVGGSVSLPVAPEVAAGASITIPGVNGDEPIAAKADGTFELGMLSPGTYEFTVKRPGYVTFTYSVEIGAEGITAVNGEAATALAPQMIAGDVSDDGNIDGRDVGVLGGAWAATPIDAHWNPAADLTGDGVVDGRDVGVLGGNWAYVRP